MRPGWEGEAKLAPFGGEADVERQFNKAGKCKDGKEEIDWGEEREGGGGEVSDRQVRSGLSQPRKREWPVRTFGRRRRMRVAQGEERKGSRDSGSRWKENTRPRTGQLEALPAD